VYCIWCNLWCIFQVSISCHQDCSTSEGRDQFSCDLASDVTEHVLPDGCSTLFDGSDLKKDHLALIVMSFVLRHKLSACAMQDLLTLLNLVVPGCIPTSNYFMQKYFGVDVESVEIHYYCSSCLSYFGKNLDAVCAECGTVSDKESKSYMLILPLELQLRQLMEQNEWGSFFTGLSDSDVKRDVSDGAAYKRLREQCNMTLQFNCDGAQVFKASNYSIWPIMCTIIQ